MSHSPRVLLLVTTDQRLMNHTKAVVDSLDFDLRVAESPLIARDLWEGAEFVLVGSDLAGKCIENLVPRRPHLLVVHTKSETGQVVAPESISERDVWRHAVALGAENVLELPTASFWLTEVLTEVAIPAPTEGILSSNVISVFAGSGGVGASTFAVNLATHAVTRGMSAVVIDLDQFGGGIDLVFGAEEIPGTRWSDIDPGSGRISADTLAAALPRANGVAFLSQSRSCLGGVSVEIVAAVIDAARRAFDLVVLDLPREHSECNELLIGQSMVTCVITRNHVRAIAASIAVSQWVGKSGGQVQFVLISDSKGLGLPDVSSTLDCQEVTEIAFMPAMTTRADEGDPPGTNSGYRQVCEVLLGEVQKHGSKNAA